MCAIYTNIYFVSNFVDLLLKERWIGGASHICEQTSIRQIRRPDVLWRIISTVNFLLTKIESVIVTSTRSLHRIGYFQRLITFQSELSTHSMICFAHSSLALNQKSWNSNLMLSAACVVEICQSLCFWTNPNLFPLNWTRYRFFLSLAGRLFKWFKRPLALDHLSDWYFLRVLRPRQHSHPIQKKNRMQSVSCHAFECTKGLSFKKKWESIIETWENVFVFVCECWPFHFAWIFVFLSAWLHWRKKVEVKENMDNRHAV